MTQTKPSPKSGLARILPAFFYSLAGFRVMLRQKAFVQELLLTALILGFLLLWGSSGGRIIGFLICCLCVYVVEALNTAIEIIVDHLSPEWSVFARDAKDIGSFAVMASLCATGLYLVWALVF